MQIQQAKRVAFNTSVVRYDKAIKCCLTLVRTMTYPLIGETTEHRMKSHSQFAKETPGSSERNRGSIDVAETKVKGKTRKRIVLLNTENAAGSIIAEVST